VWEIWRAVGLLEIVATTWLKVHNDLVQSDGNEEMEVKGCTHTHTHTYVHVQTHVSAIGIVDNGWILKVR
jgi:hypothetical protein